MPDHASRLRGPVRLLATGLWLASGAVLAQPQEPDQAGQRVYAAAGCAACHQADATGVDGVYPALAGRVAAMARTEKGRRYLVAVVAFGMVGPIQVDGVAMSGLMPPHPQLTDEEIAWVLDWLAGLGRPAGSGVHAGFEVPFVHAVRDEPVGPNAARALRDAVPGAQ